MSDKRDLLAFKNLVDDHFKKQGLSLTHRLQDSAVLLKMWLGFLDSQLCGTADELILGAKVSILQTIAAVVIGLPGNAIAQLRTQIDVVFSWLYYKDHRVEWHHASDFDDRWLLKTAIEDYLKTVDRRWHSRFALLRSRSGLLIKEPYRHLSALIHMQTVGAIPRLGNLSQLVNRERCADIVALQASVSEYVSDVLSSYFADEWAIIPHEAKENVRSRLSTQELDDFHSIDPPQDVALRRRRLAASTTRKR
jgi:hypothetical protein